MATTLTPVQTLLTLPFNHATDFTELADNCELVESDDPAEKFALCGRLSACLSILKQTLYESAPEHLRDYLTIDSWPTSLPEFNPESDALCRYCEELAQLTMQNSLTEQQRRVFEDLLFELVGYFSDRLKAPRWMKTPKGVVKIGVCELVRWKIWSSGWGARGF